MIAALTLAELGYDHCWDDADRWARNQPMGQNVLVTGATVLVTMVCFLFYSLVRVLSLNLGGYRFPREARR
jgi:hypothetical protein